MLGITYRELVRGRRVDVEVRLGREWIGRIPFVWNGRAWHTDDVNGYDRSIPGARKAMFDALDVASFELREGRARFSD